MKKYIFILTLFLASCASTQSLSWQTGVSDATIKLPDGTKNMSFLNRVRIVYPFNHTKSTVLNPNVKEIMNGAVNGFRNQIRNQRFLTIFSSSEEFKYTANGSFPTALNQTQIGQIAVGSDILVSLEMLDQAINDAYKVEIRRVNLGNNTYREVDYYLGKRTVDLKLGWRMYNTKTGAVIDEWKQEETYFYEAESLERIRATNILNSNYRRELTNLGSRYGSQYASRISPTAHTIAHKFYAGGNEYLNKGITKARAEQWDEAEKIWLQGSKKETKQKKIAMAFHNLALNEERKGNNLKAREYAKLAANQHPIGVETQSIVGF
jgi:tetratricopeptide (TPR) repeat protein